MESVLVEITLEALGRRVECGLSCASGQVPSVVRLSKIHRTDAGLFNREFCVTPKTVGLQACSALTGHAPQEPLSCGDGKDGSCSFPLMKRHISKCYLRKHMVCPSKRPPSAAAATNTFLYSAQTSPRGIRNNCGDKSACR